MTCGCKNKAKPKPADVPVFNDDAILIDEGMLSKLTESSTSSQHASCQLVVNDYVSDTVVFKLFNTNGALLHETSISKYEPPETFVDNIHNYEKPHNYIFPNKEGIASQIACHTYVHKEVKLAVDLYCQQTIDLNTFNLRIQNAAEITFENSNGLKMEFEKIKMLFNKKKL